MSKHSNLLIFQRFQQSIIQPNPWLPFLFLSMPYFQNQSLNFSSFVIWIVEIFPNQVLVPFCLTVNLNLSFLSHFTLSALYNIKDYTCKHYLFPSQLPPKSQQPHSWVPLPSDFHVSSIFFCIALRFSYHLHTGIFMPIIHESYCPSYILIPSYFTF